MLCSSLDREEAEATAQETGKTAAGFGPNGKPDFWIGDQGKFEKPAFSAIVAKDRATVDEFYRAALAAGGTDNGPPGLALTTTRITTVRLCSTPMGTTSRQSAICRLKRPSRNTARLQEFAREEATWRTRFGWA